MSQEEVFVCPHLSQDEVAPRSWSAFFSSEFAKNCGNLDQHSCLFLIKNLQALFVFFFSLRTRVSGRYALHLKNDRYPLCLKNFIRIKLLQFEFALFRDTLTNVTGVHRGPRGLRLRLYNLNPHTGIRYLWSLSTRRRNRLFSEVFPRSFFNLVSQGPGFRGWRRGTSRLYCFNQILVSEITCAAKNCDGRERTDQQAATGLGSLF